MKHIGNVAAILGLSLAVGTGAAMAQNGTSGGNASGSMPATSNSGNASMQDKKFLKEATQGSNFEIKAAHLAMDKSNSEDVKQFAQMMVDDHTKLNEQMAPVAQEAGVTPPTGISAKDQAIYNKLQPLSGNAFDQAYIKTMVKDHKTDLKAFKYEAADGRLQAEKQAASQGVSVINMHLQHADDLAKAHNVSTGASTTAM